VKSDVSALEGNQYEQALKELNDFMLVDGIEFDDIANYA
jgi:hypothetical protein